LTFPAKDCITNQGEKIHTKGESMSGSRIFLLCCIFALAVVLLAHTGCVEQKAVPKEEAEKTEIAGMDSAATAEFEEAEEDTRFIYESIGWIEIFKTAEGEVRRRLGDPDSVGKEYRSEIDGAYVQYLRYDSKGIILEMVTHDKKQERHVGSFNIFHPCSLGTEKGIGIGSAEEDIWEQYEGFINKEYSSKGQNVLLGNIYGGTFFNICDGKVETIFVGAAAE
jgi:hypothetical protein